MGVRPAIARCSQNNAGADSFTLRSCVGTGSGPGIVLCFAHLWGGQDARDPFLVGKKLIPTRRARVWELGLAPIFSYVLLFFNVPKHENTISRYHDMDIA
jgi:hypothetical protein